MRKLVLVAAFLLSLSAVWWLSQTPVAPLPPSPVSEPDPASSGSAGTSEDAVSPAGPIAADDGPALGREQVTASHAVSARSGQLEVIVKAPVDVAGSAPEVIVLTLKAHREGMQEQRRGFYQADQSWSWDWAKTFGRRVENVPSWTAPAATPGTGADAIDSGQPVTEARVFVPKPPRGARIFARVGDRVVLAIVRSPTVSSVEIDLGQPEETILKVQVVHADGKPAADVVVTNTRPDSYTWPEKEWKTAGPWQRTNAEGWVEMSLPNWKVPAAVVVGSSLVEADAGERGRIVLPPVGAIDVVVEPAPPGGRSLLGVLVSGPLSDGRTSPLQIPLQEGRVRLAPVVLGRTFELSVSSVMGAASAEFEGPTVAHESVKASLGFGGFPEIVGTLVDEAGLPVRRTQVKVSLDKDARREWPARTDEEGRLRTRVLDDRSSDGARFHLSNLHREALGRVAISARRHLGSREGKPSHELLLGEVEVEQPFQGRAFQLGTVTMRSTPVLVAGRLVDGAGQPVKGATVRVLGNGEPMGSSDESAHWPALSQRLRTTTTKGGGFVLHFVGDATDGGHRKLALTANMDDSTLPEPRSFRPGEQDVLLTLQEFGKIQIDTTSLAKQDLADMTLALVRNGSQKPALEVEPGKLTTLKRQLPGRYTMTVEMYPETAFVAQDLVVQPGETLVDPRLNPLTLDGVVQWRSLFVTGPKGAPLSRISVGRVFESGLQRSRRVHIRDGTFRVAAYLNLPPDSYWIEAEGCRRTTVPILHDGMRIELDNAVSVTLQLQGADLPERAFRMLAIPDNGSTAGSSGVDLEFNASGVATLPASTVGPYVLRPVPRTRGASSSPIASKPWWTARFTVPSEGGTVTVGASEQVR